MNRPVHRRQTSTLRSIESYGVKLHLVMNEHSLIVKGYKQEWSVPVLRRPLQACSYSTCKQAQKTGRTAQSLTKTKSHPACRSVFTPYDSIDLVEVWAGALRPLSYVHHCYTRHPICSVSSVTACPVDS